MKPDYGDVSLCVPIRQRYDAGRVRLRDFLRILFPGGGGGIILMLHAYIDDSGTHDNSSVVTMGALLSDSENWFPFELEWCAVLDREPIEIFHMSRCEAGDDPFFWEWPRRSALIHDLRQIVIRHRVLGASFSIDRTEWDKLVVGNHREYLGNAVDFAFGGVIGMIMNYVRGLYPKTPVALMIDDQKQRREDLQLILNNYETLKEQMYPELVSATFGSMRNFVPLQAADMLAWESYQYAVEWLRMGGKPPARPHFADFLKNSFIGGAIMGKAEIEKQIGHYVPLL